YQSGGCDDPVCSVIRSLTYLADIYSRSNASRPSPERTKKTARTAAAPEHDQVGGWTRRGGQPTEPEPMTIVPYDHGLSQRFTKQNGPGICHPLTAVSGPIAFRIYRTDRARLKSVWRPPSGSRKRPTTGTGRSSRMTDWTTADSPRS